MPGHAGLPAAEAEIPVAEPLASFLSKLPARRVALISWALRAFEWAPFPWRFSRLGLDARVEYLAKMERSRFGPYRELVLLAKLLSMIGWSRDPRAAAAIGYEARCAVREGTPAPAAGPLGGLRPRGDGEECDVAIVGSGAGGAVAASVLAEAGLDVLVLESGPYLDHHDYPTDTLEGLPLMYRDGGLTVAGGRPRIPIPVGRTVGGTTVINSGTCFRAPDEVLSDWRERAGIPWAGEMDSDYAAAEEMLRVEPVDPERMGRNGQLCMEGAAALGARGGPIARNAGACVQCSSCPLGCRIDAKRASHVSYLPRAVAAGARVRAGVEALRVLVANGRATGVECRAGLPTDAAEERARDGRPAAGRPWRVKANAVIAAGGAFGTPELLLRSGIAHPHLGRHLHVHPAAWIGARYPERVRGWDGVMQSYYVDEWREQGILLEATFTPLAFGAQWLPGVGEAFGDRVANYDQIGSIGVHLHDLSEGRVGLTASGELRLSYDLSDGEARTLQFGIARAAEIHFAAGATEVYPNVGGCPVLTRGRVAEFEAMALSPADLRLEAFHPMSTARMGSNAAISVTDPAGAVRGVSRLYAADASLLPSSVGVNPMMTIIACASRVARGVGAELAGERPGAAVAA
ncbi:MAG TPA: GMC family oxidoreductase N-terminal domain-containing protein [Solirubrobacterales bacterium]|jgi:choline dehydrogenase-like flavoprotein|nr:GMC family oxidoreductase N-terminal domain-containing protein [Solirubrobacterales bacterium]